MVAPNNRILRELMRNVNLESYAGSGFMRRSRLFRQYLEISFVALCNHSLSAANWTTSTAANLLGAFGAGSPGGVNFPAATKNGMSCSAKPSNFAVATTSNRAAKCRAAQAAIAACITSSVIAQLFSSRHNSSSSHRSGGRTRAPRACLPSTANRLTNPPPPSDRPGSDKRQPPVGFLEISQKREVSAPCRRLFVAQFLCCQTGIP
jgi:hypothetical protein